jgi:hypothetical protein
VRLRRFSSPHRCATLSGVKSALHLVAASAFVAGLLTLAPAAQGRTAASLALTVTFTATGSVSVTLPDGTPVGSTSGAPTVVPAGFYTVVLNGPGECINLPLFELKGPGVDIQDDMLGGETDTHTLYATFLPNSTYTWHIDRNQAVVYTFKASTVVVGTPSSSSSSPTSSGAHPKPTSQDLAGSAILPFRGTLTGAVSAAGTLTFAYKGKSVTSLKAGRYTIAVTDRSSTNGFLLEKINHAAVSVTGMAFVGRHSVSVNLTAGKWLVLPRLGKTTYSIVVLS